MSDPVRGVTSRPVALPVVKAEPVKKKKPAQPLGDSFEPSNPRLAAAQATGAGQQPVAVDMRKGMPDDATIAQTYGPLIPANRFLAELGATPAQKEVLAALEKHPQFQALWQYFEKFPGGNPLRFSSVPGLKIGNVERYGGYFPGQGLLAINPAKPEHEKNPQELADTIIHELVHAAEDVRQRALANGVTTPPWPLPKGAVDLRHDPHFGSEPRSSTRANPQMTPHRNYMDGNYGPGASNPKAEWIDINHGTQQFIVDILKDLMRQTGRGRPTITFDNLK